MKRLNDSLSLVVLGLFALQLLLASCGGAENDLNSGDESQNEIDDGEWVEPVLDTSDLGLSWDRPAKVYVPANYTAAQEWPLVFLLHGYSANGAMQDAYLKFSSRVDERGFILVIPDGTPNPQNYRFWNATDYCCDFYGQGPDDTGYLLDLINEAKDRFNVHNGQVYLTGHSNGGFMSHRMACDHADVITGIMSLAGSTHKDPTLCNNVEPVAMLQVHGTDDGTIGYEGNAAYPGAEETTARWHERNACATSNMLEGVAMEGIANGNETEVLSSSSCANNMTAELWTIKGGSHIPAFNSNFADLVLDFLFRHEKNK